MSPIAITTNGGHAQRALDFYKKLGKYFIIGGTSPWENESSPDTPNASDYKLKDVIALKSVDDTYLVVEDSSGSINYKNKTWRIVQPIINTSLRLPIPAGSKELTVNSISGIVEGSKLRIADEYEGKVVSLNTIRNLILLDTEAPSEIAPGSKVEGGAVVEGVRHVYLEGVLDSDELPLATYRQIGLCVGVEPNNVNVLRSALYSPTASDEYTSTGVLEVLDNRVPVIRSEDMSEKLSLLLEF